MKLKPLMIGFSMLAFAGAASAAGEAKTTGATQDRNRASFEQLDRDNDGSISMMEAAADQNAKQRFQQLDTNNDYQLSRAEFQGQGQQAAAGGTKQQGAQDLRSWDVAAVYRTGWSAEEMIDTDVRGANGEEIGEVKDIIVDRNGKISKVVVEVGGFLEMGDQHIGVPFKDVTIGPDMQFVQVPLREVESGTYSLYGRVPQGEDVAAAQSSWRVNELIGDYASLQDIPRYGMVTDVVFDNEGQALAVIVNRTRGAWGNAGWYGYPYAGYTGAYDYRLPYNSADLKTVIIEPFDYQRMAKESRYAGKGKAAKQQQARTKGSRATAGAGETQNEKK